MNHDLIKFALPPDACSSVCGVVALLWDRLHILVIVSLAASDGESDLFLLCVAQDSVNALYTKCLQQLLRDSHLVSSRASKRGTAVCSPGSPGSLIILFLSSRKCLQSRRPR